MRGLRIIRNRNRHLRPSAKGLMNDKIYRSIIPTEENTFNSLPITLHFFIIQGDRNRGDKGGGGGGGGPSDGPDNTMDFMNFSKI